MQVNLQVIGLHHGKPMEVDIDVTVTPAEMIEIYKSAPGIIKDFRTMMRRDKREAKAEKQRERNTRC